LDHSPLFATAMKEGGTVVQEWEAWERQRQVVACMALRAASPSKNGRVGLGSERMLRADMALPSRFVLEFTTARSSGAIGMSAPRVVSLYVIDRTERP